MSNAFFKVPVPVNEPVLSYGPGSPEKKHVKAKLKELKNTHLDIPMFIGGKKVYTEHKKKIHPPHELSHDLGT